MHACMSLMHEVYMTKYIEDGTAVAKLGEKTFRRQNEKRNPDKTIDIFIIIFVNVAS